MHESPIKIFQDAIGRQVEYDIETGILKAVVNCGVTVDKEELMKALQYDRDQYNKGFNEGYRKGVEDLVGRIGEPIDALENGDVCPDDHKCPELTPCVDCKVHKVKRIIATAREDMIGEEE